MAKYTEILFGHRIRFLTLLLIPIVLGAGLAYVLLSYRASATLQIEDPSAFGQSFLPVGWSPNQTPAQNLADSINQVVKTPAFSQSLSDSLTSSGAVSAAELKPTLTAAGTNLKASPAGSHLINLTFACPHAGICQSVVGDAIVIFRAQLAQIQQTQADAANSFWSSQLADAQNNLTLATTAMQTYAAAHPGSPMEANSSDPQAAQLFNDVELWRAKVTEAENGLSQATYQGTESTRFVQIGTTVVDPPHLTGSRYVGDGTSLLQGALVMLAGLAAVAGYVIVLAWADRTASDPKVVERRLGIPVVATIPKLVGPNSG
ncbi:MAG: hypothetical protein ACHQ0J_07050 [Candidatus Dormibacterales bacterium]